MSQYPEIIDDFLQCGKDTDYDIVHLLTTLDLNDVVTDTNHDQMNTVIRYKTLYPITRKYPFILFFALGNNTSLRSVLGLPILLAMGAEIDLVKGVLSYIELNRSFPLDLQPPEKWLPEDATLNHYSHVISPTGSTNITSNSSILHYTSAKIISLPLCLNIPSNNILVTNHFFQETVTQKLAYFLSNSSTASR